MIKVNHQKSIILLGLFLLSSFSLVAAPNTSTACILDAVSIETLPCTPNGVFYIDLNFQYESDGSTFKVTGNGTEYGTYAYADLPVEIGPFPGSSTAIYEVIITDLFDENCSTFAEFEALNCGTNSCSISGLEEFGSECFADQFAIIFGFEVENSQTNTFQQWINGQSVGFQEIDPNGPYILETSSANVNSGVENSLKVCMNDQPNCCQTISFTPTCVEQPECQLSNPTVEVLPCGPDGTYYVLFDFDYTDVNSSEFKVFGNGVVYGEFLYSNLPVEIGPFEPGTSASLELIAADLQFENCAVEIGFDAQDCNGAGDCSITDLDIVVYECYQDATLVDIEFSMNANNPGNDFWEAWMNDTFLGSHEINPNGYYYLQGIPINEFNSFKVCINDNPDCCQTIEFVPECSPTGSDCAITEVVVELTDCNDAGEFFAILNFDYTDLNGGAFSVKGNGEEYGEFFYDALPVTVGPFNGLIDPIWELIIQDLQLEDCYAETSFEGEGCEGIENCELSEINLTSLTCQDNGKVTLDLGFEVSLPGNHLWEAWINGEFLGTFELDPTSNQYELENVAGITEGENEIKICINDNPECCSFLVFEGIECTTIEGDCFVPFHHLDFGTYGSSTGEEPGFKVPGAADGVVATLQEYPGAPGDAPLFGDLNIPDFAMHHGTLFDIGLLLEFDNPNHNVEQVSVIIFEGCCFNFGINGTNIYVENLSDLPEALPNGYTVSTSPIEVNGIVATKVIISGENIESYFIAGKEVKFSQLCYEYQGTSTDCNIGPITYEIVDCTSQNFYLKIDATSNETSDAFYLGGTYPADNAIPYSELPLILGPYTFGQEIIIELIDSEDELCYAEKVLEIAECDGTPPPAEGCYGFENHDSGTIFDSPEVTVYFDDVMGMATSSVLQEFSYLSITDNPPTPFNGANGNVGVLDGTLLLEFDTEQPTEFINFDFSGSFVQVKVNGGEAITFDGIDITDSLILADNGVVLYFHREASNPFEGTVSLFGGVHHLWVGGQATSYDNFCYFFEILAAEIWPGDINADNIANHFDLLYLGIANGSEGPERSNALDSWQGQTGTDWEKFFISNGINYKHADANGDGVVDHADFLVLVQNFGNVHGPAEDFDIAQGTEKDPSLFVDLNADGPLVAGQAFQVPIVLGTADKPANEMHGLAFTLKFDPTEIDPSTVDIVLPNESWLGEDLWKIHKVHLDGTIEIAITRKDQENVDGHGPIAYFIGIIDDLVGKEIDTEIEKALAIGGDEEQVLLYAEETHGSVTTSIDQDALMEGLHVFPNPTSDVLHIRNYNELDLKRIVAYNVLGQAVLIEENPVRKNTLDVSGFENGLFFIELYFEHTQFTYKIEVIH